MHRPVSEQQELEVRLRGDLISAEVTIQLQLTNAALEVKQESRIALAYQVRSEQLVNELSEARSQRKITQAQRNKSEHDYSFHRLSTHQQLRALHQTLTNIKEGLHRTATEIHTSGRFSALVPKVDSAVQTTADVEAPLFRGVSVGVQVVQSGIHSALPTCEPST